MKAASIVNGAYFVEQCNRLRKQLKPIAFILIETIEKDIDHFKLY